jgi:hypothetical protein
LELLRTVLRLEITIFIVVLAAIVFFRLLTGEIDMGGLLFEKKVGSDGPTIGTYSPARLQLMMVTLAGAAYYFSLVTENLHAGVFELPVLPEKWLVILGGSHSLYLAGKTYSLFGGSAQQSGDQQSHNE